VKVKKDVASSFGHQGCTNGNSPKKRQNRAEKPSTDKGSSSRGGISGKPWMPEGDALLRDRKLKPTNSSKEGLTTRQEPRPRTDASEFE